MKTHLFFFELCNEKNLSDLLKKLSNFGHKQILQFFKKKCDFQFFLNINLFIFDFLNVPKTANFVKKKLKISILKKNFARHLQIEKIKTKP